MISNAKYSNFNDTIEELRINFAKDKFVTFTPKTRTVTIDGLETLEKFLLVSIIDDEIAHEISTEMGKEDITQIMRMLQQLAKQLTK